MILELVMNKWAKHDGRTFKFASGMNKIIGENEAGKSLIFEAIDFCLHGSEALRLPVSMYGNGLSASLRFIVRDVEYLIERRLSGAKLFRTKDNAILASGTTAVTAEIRKIFGYNRNVFMTSNYSSQDSIQHLAKMLPAERKRTIDNVIGLTAVEKVLKEHKAELTVLRRERESVKRRTALAPMDLDFEYDPESENKLAEYKLHVSDLTNVVSIQRNNAEQHKNIDAVKPVLPEILSVTGLITDMTDDELKDKEIQVAKYEGRLEGVKDQLKNHQKKSIEIMAEPDQTGLVKGLTKQTIDEKSLTLHALKQRVADSVKAVGALPDLSNCSLYSEEKIVSVAKQEKLYADWEAVQKLKAKGSITCNHCQGEVLLAADQIKDAYSHVPELVEKPECSSADLVKANRQLTDLLDKEKAEVATLDANLAALKAFEENWYPEDVITKHLNTLIENEKYEQNKLEVQKFNSTQTDLNERISELELILAQLNENRYNQEQLNAHWLARKNQAENERNQASYDAWKRSKDSLQPFDEDALKDAQQKLTDLTGKIDVLNNQIMQYTSWLDMQKEHDEWFKEYSAVEERITSEELGIEALNTFKARIKTTILPSVNRVASTWMTKMSEGKHTSVTLTDDMAILVDDFPIEALSVSGKALGHLSLRMALGQVLTNSIFPVFMADEIDASMRDNRAQKVLDGLTEMLNGSMKQIILISHRSLEHVENTIEV